MNYFLEEIVEHLIEAPLIVVDYTVIDDEEIEQDIFITTYCFKTGSGNEYGINFKEFIGDVEKEGKLKRWVEASIKMWRLAISNWLKIMHSKDYAHINKDYYWNKVDIERFWNYNLPLILKSDGQNVVFYKPRKGCVAEVEIEELYRTNNHAKWVQTIVNGLEALIGNLKLFLESLEKKELIKPNRVIYLPPFKVEELEE